MTDFRLQISDFRFQAPTDRKISDFRFQITDFHARVKSRFQSGQMTLQQIFADYLSPKITDFRLQNGPDGAPGGDRFQISDFNGADICKGRQGAESDFRFQISTGPAAGFQRVRLQITDANAGLWSSIKSSADFRFQISDATALLDG